MSALDIHSIEIVNARIEHWQFCIDNFQSKEKNSKIKNIKVLISLRDYWVKYKNRHYGKTKIKTSGVNRTPED